MEEQEQVDNEQEKKEDSSQGGVKRSTFILSLIGVALVSVIGTSLFFKDGRDSFSDAEGTTPATILHGYQLIQSNFFGEVDDQALIDGALSGMTSATEDPYTIYMPEEESEALDDSISASFEGIGAEVMKEGDYVKIVAPISGSPAEEAGLQPNDIILAVDGESSQGKELTDVVAEIRGEKGSEVTLTIRRGDLESDVTLVRDAIPIETVNYQVDEQNPEVGYIEITSFSEPTYEDVVVALKDFESQGIDQVIFDVRKNPGGLLTSAIQIANIFVPEGERILSVENENGESQVYDASDEYGDYLFEGDAVLLVDEGSASASEILAGAMQNQGIPLVGQQTFGKGTVQSIQSLPNAGDLKMTTGHWLTASGEWINEKGLTPDHEVAQPDYVNLLFIDSTQTYAEGQSSAEVENINAFLRALGYDAPEGADYTDQTSQAVQSFQADHDLEQDGIVTGETATSLVEALRDQIQTNDRQYESALELFQD